MGQSNGNDVGDQATLRGARTAARRLALGLLVAAGAFVAAPAAAGAATFSNPARITIPAGDSTTSGPADPYPSTIEVSGLSGRLTDVDVSLRSLSHPDPLDLNIAVVGPNGEAVLLLSEGVGGLNVSSVFLSFDDDAASHVPFSDELFSGTYRPTNYNGFDGPVDSFPAPGPGTTYCNPGPHDPRPVADCLAAAFNGSNPNGTWSLYVVDTLNGSSGRIGNGWSLEVETTLVTNTRNGGPGSLRQAIIDANAAAGPDAIGFAPGLSGTIFLAGPLPSLSDEVEIIGPGADQLTVRRDSGGEYRIFTIDSGLSATIAGLTVANGRDPNGGGIANLGGNVTLEDLVVAGNTATSSVGGVRNHGGTMTVRRTAIVDNVAAVHTGGIGNFDGEATLTIEDSTVAGNTATGSGGGGISNGGGSGALTIRRSTITDNTATFPSGGGGVLANGGPVAIENSTVSGNGSPATGANLAKGAGTLTLKSTIVSEPEGGQPNCAGTIGSRGFNLASDASCGLAAPTDQPPTDPELGPLADNGGPTETMAPSASSPALDQGLARVIVEAAREPQVTGALMDQRGESRPVDLAAVSEPGGGDGADVGAVELQASEIPSAQASITGGPSGPTQQNQPTFSFDAQGAVELECSIDQGTAAYGPCSDPAAHTPAAPLADGPWTFRVWARNALDETAVDTRTFTVDTEVPDTHVPDTTVPDTTVPDTKVPDTKVPDTKVPDTEITGARLEAKKAQKQKRRVKVKIEASAAEPVDLLAKGKIKLKGQRKAVKLKPQRKAAAADATVKLVLKPAKKKDQRKVLKSLAAGKRAVAPISIRFSDAAGNERVLKAKLRLR